MATEPQYNLSPTAATGYGQRQSGPPIRDINDLRMRIALGLMGKREPFAQNIGQGIASIGNRFADYAMMQRLQQQEDKEQADLAKIPGRGEYPSSTARTSAEAPAADPAATAAVSPMMNSYAALAAPGSLFAQDAYSPFPVAAGGQPPDQPPTSTAAATPAAEGSMFGGLGYRPLDWPVPATGDSAPPVRMASLNPAAPGNPPVATDIVQAPPEVRTPNAQVAQAQVPGASTAQISPRVPQRQGDTAVPPTPPTQDFGTGPTMRIEKPVLQKAPMTQTELHALQMMSKTQDSNWRAYNRWLDIANYEASKRAAVDAVSKEEYEKLMPIWAKQTEEDIARGTPKGRVEQAIKENTLRQETPVPLTPVPRREAFRSDDEYNAALRLQQQSGQPQTTPPPPGMLPPAHQAAEAKRIDADRNSLVQMAQTFPRAMNLIQQIQTHPGTGKALGLNSLFAGIPGTDARGAVALMQQLKSGAFVQVYREYLRGTGAIATKEGQTAAASLERVDNALTPKDFMKALADFEHDAKTSMEALQRRMGQPVTAWRGPGDNESYAPNIGEIRTDKNGVRWEYLGGNPEEKSSRRRLQ